MTNSHNIHLVLSEGVQIIAGCYNNTFDMSLILRRRRRLRYLCIPPQRRGEKETVAFTKLVRYRNNIRPIGYVDRPM